jgi:hypothetical protein
MSLKHPAKDSANEGENAGDRDPNCWRRGRDCACLRVDISADEVFIFPYQQCFGAHHVSTATVDILKITFMTHEVTLTGHRLEKLLPGLQDFAIDHLLPLPARYRNLGEGSEPEITAITVRALSDAAEAAPARER